MDLINKQGVAYFGLLGVILLSLAMICPVEVLAKNPPNIIYIMADDLGIGDLGCYGQKQINTPAIDKLASSGIKFTQHYSGSTVCAPSRCSLMTGKHTGNASIRGNNGYLADDGYYYDQIMPKDELTVAKILSDNGYTTACVGKWGLGGPNSVSAPNDMGFDYFYGYLGQGNAHSYYPEFLYENGEKQQLGKKEYSHDLIMDKAINFLEENNDKPFFLYLSPTIPHADLDIPEEWMEHYKGKFFETPFINKKGKGYKTQKYPRAAFAAMVSRLDNDVQQIINLLEEKGIRDNTIVIFTSDNGTHKEGGHDPDYFDSNGPYRGNKRDLYDGGIKAPFIVSWPSSIKEPLISYHVSAFWDFLPTVCDIINVPSPVGVDGISYLPTLTRKGEQKKHDYLYFEFHEQGGRQAVIKDGWKLIKLNVNKPNETRFELYNLHNDPSEIANVLEQYPSVKNELLSIMNDAHNENDIWKFKFEK